jgi:hypothetical protein
MRRINFVDAQTLEDVGSIAMPAMAVAPAESAGWGWFPVLSVVSAVGLLLVSIADALSRAGQPLSDLLFWGGLLVIVVPLAIRLTSETATRRERLGLIVLLGTALYIVKVMHSPFIFAYSDEYLHLYNAEQILNSGTWFHPNPILEVSPFYPGLASAAAALSAVSGLSLLISGTLIIGIARLILMLALYLLYEQVSNSGRAAALGTLIYTAHSNFLFWSAQFSYESLALPLAILVLYIVKRRESLDGGTRHLGWTWAALLGIGAVVITHHLSAYFMAAFLVLWTLGYSQIHVVIMEISREFFRWYAGDTTGREVFRALPAQLVAMLKQLTWLWRPLRAKAGLVDRQEPGWLGLVALLAVGAWFFLVAGTTSNYLGSVFGGALNSMVLIITGQATTRELFVSSSGYVEPLWEQIVGIGSVFLLLAALPFGLRVIWQHLRRDVAAILLAGLAVTYFAALGLRFSAAAWEIGNRVSAFAFVGLAFALGLAGIELWKPQRAPWLGRIVLAVCAGIVFMGGIIAGWPPLLRLAQPFEVAVGQQIIESQSMAVGRWMLSTLGPGNSVAADESSGRLMLAYTDQYAHAGRHDNIKDMLSTPQLAEWQLGDMNRLGIQYFVLDRRVVSWDSMMGYYFDRTDGAPVADKVLFGPEIYQKVDNIKNVQRIYDSGSIAVYDVRVLSNVPTR